MDLTPTEIIAIAGPASALAGALLGAIAAYLAGSRQAAAAAAAGREQAEAARAMAQRQIEASTVLASRQRWIDDLRQDVSDLVASMLKLHNAIELQTTAGHQDWMNEVVRASMLETKVMLRVHPSKAEDQRLLNAIAEPLNALRHGRRDHDWGAAATGITEAARVLLKQEWDSIQTHASMPPNESLQLTNARSVPTASTTPTPRVRS